MEILILVDEIEVAFVIEVAELDKALRPNKKILARVFFCFTRDSFYCYTPTTSTISFL